MGSRGRGSFRGGRGGYRGGRGGSKTHKSEDQENIPPSSVAEQGEVGELIKQYGDKVSTLRELFPDWSDEDLVYALKETDGDLESAIDRMSSGQYFSHSLSSLGANYSQGASLNGRKTRKSSPNPRKFTHLRERQLPHAEGAAVLLSRGVVVGEEQNVGEEVVVVELAHKRMARDQRTQQQRRPTMAGKILLHLRRTHLVVRRTMLVLMAKLLRLATGRQMLRIKLLRRRPWGNRRAMLFRLGRFQGGTSYSRNPNPHLLPSNFLQPHPYLNMRQLCRNLR